MPQSSVALIFPHAHTKCFSKESGEINGVNVRQPRIIAEAQRGGWVRFKLFKHQGEARWGRSTPGKVLRSSQELSGDFL